MKLYSDLALRRTAEIVGDLVAIVVLVAGIGIALGLHAAIAALGDVGLQLQTSGEDFSGTMSDIGENLSGVPVIGGGIASPFDGAASAGQTLADAGRGYREGVELVASLAGWTVAVLFVLLIVGCWVVPRTVAVVRRTRLARVAASVHSRDLLALRALAHRPAHRLAAIADPVGGWRRGDPATLAALAALELRAGGVRAGPGS